MILGIKVLRQLKTWFPVLCLVYLYIFTFVFILPIQMKDKVYSAYFGHNKSDPSIVRRATEKNAERLNLAKLYLGMYATGVKERNKNRIVTTVTSGLDITIGIITIQRPVEQTTKMNLGYLTQVVAGFHRLSKQDTLFRIKNIFICNVDPVGENYNEASQYSPIMDVAVKYRAGSTNHSMFKNWDKFDKEKSDYQFCLNHSTSYGTPFVLLVEDDAIPKDDVFTSMLRILTQRELTHGVHTEVEQSNGIGFIKLYYPEKWAGYSSEQTHVLEQTLAAFVGGNVFLVTSILWLSIQRTRTNTKQAYTLSFLCGALYALLLTRTIGRPYILEYLADTYGYYRVIPAKGCCTPAVLYPRESAARLVNYLGDVKCHEKHSVDIAMDKFAASNSLRTWLVEPNLFQHIGMYSTVRQHSKLAAEFI